MKTTRLINKIIIGCGLFAALLLLAAPMDDMTTKQFVTLKVVAAAMAYGLGGIAKYKHERDEI